MTTQIEIDGLRLYGRHGVMDQERIVGNLFEVSVVLRFPAGEAMRTDNLDTTINYAEAIETIRRAMDIPSQLIEHVAGRILQSLTRRFPQVSGGRLTVRKLCPPCGAELDSVGFTVEW